MRYLGTNNLTRYMPAMQPNDYLLSTNGLYQLTMWPDGTLALGLAGQTSPVAPNPPWRWQSGTANNDNATCVMSAGGDLFIDSAGGVKIYHSGTSGNVNAYLTVTNDGDLYILTASGAQLNPPWDNGGMYSYPGPNVAHAIGQTPNALVEQFRTSVQALHAHFLMKLDQLAVQFGDTGSSPSYGRTPPGPSAGPRNGDARLAAHTP